MLLSESVQLCPSLSVMLCRNVTPPYINENKGTNRYLIHRMLIMHIFFSFFTAISIGHDSIQCVLLSRRGQEWFCVSKARAMSWPLSIQEMSSCAEKLDCWNETWERSLTHPNPIGLRPCPWVSASWPNPKPGQEPCCWLNGMDDHLLVLRPVPRPWPVYCYGHSLRLGPIPLQQQSQCGLSSES